VKPFFDIEAIGAEAVETELERLRKERHEHSAAAVVAWLTGARKKDLPDLVARMKKMNEAIYRLAETMKFKIKNGEIVVIAEGSSEQTLTQLLLGTNWFEPDIDLVAQLLSGLFTASS
jgi:pyruvate/2-oxoacid:ferredoxin oxidoreductase alpha subunit